MRWVDLIAIYAALVSTYQALRWMMQERPYYTFFQPEIRRPADSLTVRIHNPGRRMLFIQGDKARTIRSKGTEALVKATPRGDPVRGITPEYAAYLLSGELLLAIPPGGSAEFNVGPVYPNLDFVFALDWRRGAASDWMWPHWFSRITNPLRIRVNPEIERLLSKGRTDLDSI